MNDKVDREIRAAAIAAEGLKNFLTSKELMLLHSYLTTCVKVQGGVVAPAALRSPRLKALAQWALEAAVEVVVNEPEEVGQ